MKTMHRCTSLIVALLAVAFAGVAEAQTARSWNVTSGVWQIGSNWVGGSAPANDTTTNTAVFSGTSTQAAQLNAAASIAGLTFSGSGTKWIMSDSTTARVLTIGSSGITASAGSGAITIGSLANPLNLEIGTQSWTNDSSSLLTVVGTVRPSASTAGTDTLTVPGSGNTLISGAVNNNSSRVLALTKSGAGVLTLSGSNSYTGGTTLNAGLLSFANNGLGTSGAVTLNGGTLQWASGNTQDISSRLTLVSGSTATFHTNGNSVTLATSFGGATSAALAKVGSGTLTLNASTAYTYTGKTSVNAGTLALDFANLSSPTNLLSSSSPLELGGGNLTIKGKSSGATAQTFAGTTIISGGGSLLVDPGAGTSTTVTLGALTTTAAGGSFLVGTASGATNSKNTITTTTNKDAQGIYGSRVVFWDGSSSGYNWATTTSVSSPYTLSGLASYTSLATTAGTDTANSFVSASGTLTGSRTTNSLKSVPGSNNNPTLTIGTGNTLTLTSGGLLTAGFVSNISGGTLTAGNGSGSYELVTHIYQAVTISSAIADNGANAVGLTKAGSANLTLSGNNSYTGATVVNAGAVVISNANALGATSAGTTINSGGWVDLGVVANVAEPFMLNGGLLSFSANSSGTFSGLITVNTDSTLSSDTSINDRKMYVAGGVAINNANLSLKADTTYITGTVSGNGVITTAQYNGGQGRVQLDAANTFTGAIIVSNTNWLYLGNAAAVKAASSVRVDSGSRLYLGPYGGTATGGNVFEGSLVLNGGELYTQTNASDVAWTGPITLTADSFVNVRRFTATGALALNGIIDTGTSTLIYDNGGVSTASNGLTINSKMTGSGGFTVQNTQGQVRLSAGGSDYSGTTTIASTAYRILLLADNATSPNSDMIINRLLTGADGALNLNGFSTTIGALSGTGSVYGISSKTLTIGNTSRSGTFGGTISGAMGVTKTGTATQIFSGSNSYTATTTASAGVLRLESANALPGGIGATGGSSGLTINGGVIGLGNGDFARGLGTGTDQVQITGGGGFAAYNADRTVNLGGTSGTATWGSGSFITTAGGTFVLGAADATNMVTFQNPIDLGSSVRTVRIDDGSAAVDATLSGVLSSVSAGNGLTKTGAGTLDLTAANSFNGTLAVQNGTVRFTSLAATTTAQNLGAGTLVNLGVAGTSAGEIDYRGLGGTLSKNITALGSGRNRIRNSGGGTLTLSGTLTKDGTILELASGTFDVSGRITGATVGTSDLFVNAAAVTLSNTNNDYNGPTYVYGGGSLTLGASNVIPAASSLILGGTGSDTGTGTFNTGLFNDTVLSLTTGSLGATIGITGSGATMGGLTTTGNVTFGAGTDTLALSLTSLTAGRYQLVTYQGTRSGTFDTVTGLTDSRYTLVYGGASGSSIDLQMKADQSSTFTLTPASARVLVGGSTQLSGGLANSSPTGAASLAWSPVSSGSLSAITSSLGSTIAGGSTSTITAWISAGNTAGTQTWSITNTDNNAITNSSTASGSITVVNQRTFEVSNSGTINLGNFLRTASVTGSTTISSSGLNATTANATLGSFSGTSTNGFSLATLDSPIFNGGTSSQSALYTLSGSAASAGAINGTFTSLVSAELGSIDPVTVSLVGTAYDPATAVLASGGSAIGNAWTISLGEFNQGAGFSTPWDFAISNLLASNLYTADLVLDSFSVTSNSGAIFMDLSGTSFPTLSAGGTNAFTAWMSLANTGTFTNVYQLNFASAKNNQTLGGSQNVTLTVTGVIIVPEPGALALAGIGIAAAAYALRSRSPSRKRVG